MVGYDAPRSLGTATLMTPLTTTLTPFQSITGVCQETCRDFGHMQMGFGAAINTAETAYIQGVDLYAKEMDRLVAAAEFASSYLLGKPVTDILCSGEGIHLTNASTFEVAYAHLAKIQRNPMPHTWKQIITHVRPDSNQFSLTGCYETLTHGEPSEAD